MVQSLARCRECGLPSMLVDTLDWSPGGIILLRGARPLRLALLDQMTAQAFQSSLEERFTRDACLRAETEAVRAATSRDLSGLKGRLSRYGTLKRRTLEALEENSPILGLGRIELEKFTPGEGGAMLLRRPFILGMTTAVVTGVLEGMDHCSYAIALTAVGDHDYRLVLEASGYKDVNTQRKPDAGRQKAAGAGESDSAGCRQCGLPSSLAAMRWDELYGSIQAGVGGRRVALLPACLLDAPHVLEGAGREEREAVLREAAYRATRESLQDGASDAYEGESLLSVGKEAAALREAMFMRGWGEVQAASLSGEDWRVEMLNPVDDTLIAGWLSALYTVAVGREPQVEVGGEQASRIFELA